VLHAQGQMQMGIAHDNVNVTENIRINPALAVDPIPWFDIKLTGIYAIAVNNGVYMEKDSVNIWKNQYPTELTQNFNKNQVSGQSEAIVYGPAFNVSLGKFSVGMNTAFRNYVVGRDLTKEITQAIVDGPQIPEYYNQKLDGGNYRVKGMSFAEIGVNGGYMLYEMGGTIVNIGANVKYIFGVGGINMLVDNFSYEMQDTTTATIYDYTGQYGGGDLRFGSGKGVGIDLGITYEKKVNKNMYIPHNPSSKCRYTEYLYRIGFSVLDIGSVKFKRSAYRKVENGGGPWNDYATYEVESISDIISEADQLVGNGIVDSDTEYKAKLPLSFSLQFDYNVGQGIFVNAFLLYGAGLKNSFGAERLSMLAITPRYETKRMGFAAPISINELGKAGLGFSVRFWYLSFGTDNILPLVFNMNIYRMDAYAQLKFPILKSNKCKKKGLGENIWHFKDCSGPGAPSPRGKQKRDYSSNP
jgi:hypothetical protein